MPPNVLPLIGGGRLAARGANPILEAPAGHTLCQYAGLNGIPGSGPGIFGYAEEDVLVKHSHLKKHTAVARATAGNSPTPCRVIVIGCVSCNTLSHFRQRVSCNSAHAATIGSVLKVSCNRPTRVVFVIGRVSCKPKIGGALKTSHPPPRPRPSAAPCWPIHRRSWSREHRASCGTRMRGPSPLPLRPVRPHARASASSAALRSTRRASATFKRGASQGRRERRPRWHFLRGRLPLTVVNWGSTTRLLLVLLLRYTHACACACGRARVVRKRKESTTKSGKASRKETRKEKKKRCRKSAAPGLPAWSPTAVLPRLGPA